MPHLKHDSEAEQKLQQDEHWSTSPKPRVDVPAPTVDFGGPQLVERSRQWYEIVHLALQTDSTRVVSLWLDPQNSAMFNAAPVCAACHNLPPAVKRAKELAMLRAIWPRGRWRVQKGADPAYLRGRR